MYKPYQISCTHYLDYQCSEKKWNLSGTENLNWWFHEQTCCASVKRQWYCEAVASQVFEQSVKSTSCRQSTIDPAENGDFLSIISQVNKNAITYKNYWKDRFMAPKDIYEPPKKCLQYNRYWTINSVGNAGYNSVIIFCWFRSVLVAMIKLKYILWIFNLKMKQQT